MEHSVSSTLFKVKIDTQYYRLVVRFINSIGPDNIVHLLGVFDAKNTKGLPLAVQRFTDRQLNDRRLVKNVFLNQLINLYGDRILFI